MHQQDVNRAVGIARQGYDLQRARYDSRRGTPCTPGREAPMMRLLLVALSPLTPTPRRL